MTPDDVFDRIPEIRSQPLARRGGGIYRGRFEIRDPHWILNPDDLHATASISIRDIATAAEGNLIWTDQVVQRGVKPEVQTDVDIELSLAAGYPDSSVYVFNPGKADAIAERLLYGPPGLMLSPLVWNLRPEHFEAAIDTSETPERMYLYSGRIYLPDGHHRHQGILRAFRAWQDEPEDYPEFDSEREFTIDIYFMSRRGEAEYFFQKNQLTQQVDRSKSYDLTEQDSLSVLAKRVIEKSESLDGNVNRVTDRLAASNPQVITLSTLREVMRSAVDTDELTSDEIEDLAPKIAQFWDLLAGARPELGRLNVDERRSARRTSMAAQAVVMHGYAELIRRFLIDADAGTGPALSRWRSKLGRLRSDKKYKHASPRWEGDFFSRDNPLWTEIGVLQRTKSNGQAVSNVRQTREQVRRALVERLNL